MSTIFLGEIEEGSLNIQTLLPDLNSEATLDLGAVEGVAPGHTILATNLDNEERACALVNPEGGFRVHLPTDLDDRISLRFYETHQPCLCDKDCVPTDAPTPYATFDQFGQDVNFQGLTYGEGTPLRAIAEGLGLQRATPALRRFMGIGQLVLDPGDPNSLAPHYTTEPLKYPAVGDETSTHTIVVTSMGDMNVPASSGVSVSRAAGYVNFLDVDSAYADSPFAGVPPNQILLDTYTAEAVHTLNRFQDAAGNPVHYDVENFSEGEDIYQDDGIPRLNPPLRLGLNEVDPTGGVSGAMFLFVHPTGWHGFALPGTERAKIISACEDACEDDPCRDACPEQAADAFDGGDFMSGMLANYFASGGTRFMTDACLGLDNCPGDKPPFPEPRDNPGAQE